MPKLNHIVVTAQKDNVRVITAKKTLTYRKVEGLPNQGMPEGQVERYDQEHGMVLQKDQTIEIDVSDAQLAEFQKAVDAGDLEVQVHRLPAAVVVETMPPSAPPSAPPESAKKDARK